MWCSLLFIVAGWEAVQSSHEFYAVRRNTSGKNTRLSTDSFIFEHWLTDYKPTKEMRSASVCFWNHLYPFLSQKDDNAVIEMSLKLASIYATQNKWVLILCWESESSKLFDLLTSTLFSNWLFISRNELAEHGFQFCTESLEAKIEKQKELPPESLSGITATFQIWLYVTANRSFVFVCRYIDLSLHVWLFTIIFELDEERKDTRLLLGLSLDARARYLASNRRFTGACRDYRHALQICQEEQGESHPQVMTLHTGTYVLL